MERQPVRGLPWRDFVGKYGSLDRSGWCALFPAPFLVVEELDAGGLERMFKTRAATRIEKPDTDKIKGTQADFLVPPGLFADGSDRRVFEVARVPGPRPFPHVTLGRTAANDIVLAAPTISKCHAFFKQEPGGGWSIVDAGSTNGTTLNGKVLGPHEPKPLVDGSFIAFGRAFGADFYQPATLHALITTPVGQG